jgi:DNA-binding transcriptional MerR regulator
MEWQVKDVCKIVGIKMSQAQYWTRLEAINPDITGPTTQGKARLFSLRNLFEFALMKELTKRGIGVTDAKDILEKIRENYPSLMDEGSKYELITQRTLADPLLVYFGNAFFLGNFLDMETKGIRQTWFGEPPPPRFLEDLRVRGLGEKLTVILYYYPSAVLLDLATIRRDLLERVKAQG